MTPELCLINRELSRWLIGLGKNHKERQRAWRELVKETLDIEVLSKIRHCANTGLVLATESFRAQGHKLRN